MEKYNKESDETKKAEIETNPHMIFLTALENCKPLLKMTPINKGGITYQVPVPMSEKERESKAIKMLITTANDKDRNMRFYDRLALELIDAFQNKVNRCKIIATLFWIFWIVD